MIGYILFIGNKRKIAALKRSSEPKRPSIKTVAGRANVSIATVSRVINGDGQHVSKQTLERVKKAVSELNYQPQGVGRSLRTGETPIIAVLVPDVTNIMGTIALSLDSALRDEKKMIFLCNTRGDPSLQDEYLQQVRAHLVSGIVMIGAVESPGLKNIAEEEDIVFVIRKSPYNNPSAYVGIDQYIAGKDVASFIFQQGYKHVAMIHGPLSSSANREMLYGFRDGLSAFGIPLPEDNIRVAESWSIEGGYREGSSLLDIDPRPEIIFCAGDKNAYGVYRRCMELNLRVHEDVMLFGFEDNSLNQWLAPWLNTVRIPYDRFGSVICKVLRQMKSSQFSDGAPQILLPHELVIRHSSASNS